MELKMTRTTVIMNDGRIKTMETRFARALVKLKKAIIIDDYKTKVITQSEVKKEVALEEEKEIQLNKPKKTNKKKNKE